MADDIKTSAAELMKKVLTVGVGAIFLTEESLRSMISEFKLPKELLNGVIDSANKSKNEFLQSLSHDVISRVMDRLDAAAVIQEIFEKNEIELNVKINIRPKTKKSKSALNPTPVDEN